VILAPLSPAHESAIAAILSEEPRLGVPRPGPREPTALWLRRRLADPFARTFVASTEELGVFGVTALERIEAGTAELTYWVSSGFRGRGLGTAAARATVELAFDSLGLRTLDAWVAETNAGSRAILERLAFARRAVTVMSTGAADMLAYRRSAA
jgi:RimJ/RimL family protein N-acetyltransferase